MRVNRHFILCLLTVIFSLNVNGQVNENQSLRDSLAKASELLAYYPDSIDLRLKKAAWNIELRQWQYAKEDYDKVLKLQPDNLAALYYRAFVNERLGRYNFARIDYENLLKIVPGNFEAQLGYAILNEKDKHYTEALDQMNRLISQFPGKAVAYAVRAGMEKDREMLEVAEYDITEAIKRDSENTDYILQRAEIYILENKFTNAKRDLDRLVKLGIPRTALADFYKQIK